MFRVATLTVLAALWLVAATLLWRTSVPHDLRLPHLDPRAYFGSAELARTSRYERFLRIDYLLGLAADLVVLAGFALAGRRLARYFGPGRVLVGVLVAMALTAVLWVVDLPFGLAVQWWERRHGISRQSYGAWLGDSWFVLGGRVVGTCLLVALLMVLAGRLGERWWIGAGGLLVGLGLVFLVVSALLVGLGKKPLRDRALASEIRSLARAEGADHPSVSVDDVRDKTTAANAEAIGVGPIRRVVFWNTLLDGRFSHGEVHFVAAHELAHLARQHVHKGFAWFVLLTIPLWYLVALVTRRRGGLAQPEAVPLALLAVTVLQLALLPLENAISRRYEAEADWVALRTTHDPASARRLFERFSETSLVQPRPPTWAYVLLENHPTLLQRIAMAQAWGSRNPGAALPAGS